MRCCSKEGEDVCFLRRGKTKEETAVTNIEHRPAGATVARSTPVRVPPLSGNRKVIRSNRVWVTCFFFWFVLFCPLFCATPDVRDGN